MNSKSMKPVRATKTSFLSVYAACAAVLFLGTILWSQSIQRQAVSRRQQHDAVHPISSLPLCKLESALHTDALENAVWIDPVGDHDSSHVSETLVPHPLSNDMDSVLKFLQQRDPADSDRLERIARLQLDTQGQCRLKAWDKKDFKKCLANRRIIFIGDSMSMQQAESLGYLLDLRTTWIKMDNSKREKGKNRHSIDAVADSGLTLMARAVFHSDQEDVTPLKFSQEAWTMMAEDFGGWKQGDILIVNFGAHYMADLMDLRSDLETLFFHVLSELPSYVDVFWRDYAPAHFQSFPDGEYPPSHHVKFANESACVPHLTAPRTPSIVKHTVNQILNKCGDKCGRIRRLQIWELLRNAWDQHSEGSHCWEDKWCDCRHFAIPGPMDYANVLLYNQLCNAEE